MAEITAALVKELRERSGVGMMDCKKALVETNGDIEAAIDWLRAKGLSKAAKKADRVAAEGLVAVAVRADGKGEVAAAIEFNAETDFVARNDLFQTAAKSFAQLGLHHDGVDAIHESIKLYLVKVSRNELSEAESRRLVEIITLITNLEHIGDIIDKNLRELGEKKIRKRYAFSPEGLAEIRDFHQRVASGLRLALNVFATRDVALARQLFAEKAPMRDAERHAAESHFERLRSGRPESIETSAIHLDIIRDLKRIHGHAVAIGYPILESANALRESRLKADEESKSEVKLAAAPQPGR